MCKGSMKCVWFCYVHVPYNGFFLRITNFANLPQNTAIFYLRVPLFAILGIICCILYYIIYWCKFYANSIVCDSKILANKAKIRLSQKKKNHYTVLGNNH